MKVLAAFYTDSRLCDLLGNGVEGSNYVVGDDGLLYWPEGKAGIKAVAGGTGDQTKLHGHQRGVVIGHGIGADQIVLLPNLDAVHEIDEVLRLVIILNRGAVGGICLADMSELINNYPEVLDLFKDYPEVLDCCRIDGKLVALPTVAPYTSPMVYLCKLGGASLFEGLAAGGSEPPQAARLKTIAAASRRDLRRGNRFGTDRLWQHAAAVQPAAHRRK